MGLDSPAIENSPFPTKVLCSGTNYMYLCRFAKQIICLNLKVHLENLQRPSTNGNINIL